MLIVKGKNQKSVLANILLYRTKSICFQYYDYPVIYDAVCVESTKYSLNDFIECIAEEFEKVSAYEAYYDYLIIYTNEKEEDLKELIEWFNEHGREISCKNILVMCK